MANNHIIESTTVISTSADLSSSTSEMTVSSSPPKTNSSLYLPFDLIVYHYSQPFVIVMSTLMVIFIVLSVVGNTLVIMTVIRNRQMRTRTNLFLVNLAVADIMVATLDMPVALVTIIKGRWVFGEVMCQLNGFTVGLGTMLSVHTLMHISVHKYISMTRPFSRFMTRQRILIIIGLAWLWCILYNLTPQMGLTHTVYKPGASQCGPEIPRNPSQMVHSLINSCVNLYLPLIIMFFCYIRIFWEIKAHLGRMRENSNMAERSSVLQQKKIAVTLFMVLSCFVLCLVPYLGYSNWLGIAKDKSQVPRIYNPIAYWFLYMNSVLNPIIYGARSSSFRQSYRNILLGKKRSKALYVGSIRSNGGSIKNYNQRVLLPASTPFRNMSAFGTASTPRPSWSTENLRTSARRS